VGGVPRRAGTAAFAHARPLSTVPAAEPSALVVFGTGALACAIGARLARGGERVTLVGTWTAARDAIARRGVVVHEADETWSARVGTASSDAAAGPVDVVLVLVKSHRTAGIVPAAARLLSPGGIAVTLQNGLGHRETLEAALGASRVAVGVAFLGARLLGPGEVQVVPGRIVLGEEPGGGTRARLLAERLGAAGLEVETTPDVEGLVWAKLAANCAINPLSALHGVVNGALLEDPGLRRSLRAAAREVGAVASARGTLLLGDAADRAEAVARATASNRSSMLQDVERGASTEIDALCGAVVREGTRLGVPTPANDELWRRVRAREGRPVDAEAWPATGREGRGAAGGERR